jgi:hypothetical protein
MAILSMPLGIAILQYVAVFDVRVRAVARVSWCVLPCIRSLSQLAAVYPPKTQCGCQYAGVPFSNQEVVTSHYSTYVRVPFSNQKVVT